VIPLNAAVTYWQKGQQEIWRQKAHVGRRYYYGKHDILDRRLFYVNAEGELTEDTESANYKISNPFFTELVDQCRGYMLSGSQPVISSDNPETAKLLDEYFGTDLKDQLGELLESIQVEGRGYLYLYRGQDNRWHTQAVPALQVTEVPGALSPTGLPFIIRQWAEPTLDKTLIHLEVWEEDTVTFYVADNEGPGAVAFGIYDFKLDPNVPVNPRPHVLVVSPTGEPRGGYGLGRLPFFRVDANTEGLSLLGAVKDLIDDYDIIFSGFSNNIESASEVLTVVTGMAGTDMKELQNAIKRKKMIGLPDGDGGVDIKEINIPYEARQTKLEMTLDAIYRFGRGFNAARLDISNVTNVALKSRYALLDMKCADLENRLQKMLRVVIEPVLADLGLSQSDVTIRFDKELFVNELDSSQTEHNQALATQAYIDSITAAAELLGRAQAAQMIAELLDKSLDITVPEPSPEEPEPVQAPASGTASQGGASNNG